MNRSATDPLEIARQQILALAREIELLAGARLPEDFFFAEYLKRVIVALGAEAAAVWLIDPKQGIALRQHMQRVPIGVFENPQALPRYNTLLAQTLQSGGVKVYGTGDPKLAEMPTPHVLILGALERGGKPAGVLQIFQRADAPTEARAGYLQFIEQMCGYVTQYFRALEQPAGGGSTVELKELESLTAELHASLDISRIASAAANDGSKFLGCDRVSMVEWYGGKPVVRAISGQDAVNPRANLVRLLSQLVGQVIATGERFQFSGKAEGLPPQIEEPLAEYLHVSRSRQLTIAPLAPPENRDVDEPAPDEVKPGTVAPVKRPLGALVAEQVTDGKLRPDFASRLDLLCEQTSLALANSREYHAIFLMPVWRFLGKRTSWLKGRRLAQVAAALAALALLTVALIIIPWEYRVEGKGRLMPVVRRGVFAPWDGEVAAIEAASGEHVGQGQMLVRLHNEELHARVLAAQTEASEKSQKRLALHGELTEGERNLTPEQTVRLRGQIAQAQIEAEGALKRLAVLNDLEKSLNLQSPLSGVVATFQVTELLSNRPVKRGDLLLEVMDETGPWRLELEIPEHRAGHVFEGQQKLGKAQLPVDFILATATETTHHATLEASATRSIASDEGGTVVEMFAALDSSDLPQRRIGAEVIAKIHCGKRSLGYVLFGDVIEFLRKYLWL